MNQMDNFVALTGMCEKRTFVINHVAPTRHAAFGQDLNDGEGAYLSASFVKKYNMQEGDVIEALVIPNKHGKRKDTQWRVVNIRRKASIYEQIEELGGAAEPVEPEAPLEDRVFEFFEENADNCFSTREVCLEILGTAGVNSDVRRVLVTLHNEGDLCQLRIKRKGAHKKSIVLWGLNVSSFGFDDEVEEADDVS